MTLRLLSRPASSEAQGDTNDSAQSEPVPVLTFDPRIEKERALALLIPTVRATVYRMLGPRLSRDDIVQDALIAVARALDKFEGRSSLETYARRITVHVVYRALGRKRVAESDIAEHEHAASGLTPEAELAQNQALSRLHRCLERLPETRRAAFVLCGIEEMTPQAAADLVGISAGAMRARYMHARRDLARMLGLKLKGPSHAS